MMEGCTADLLLHAVQFLNVRDSGRLALASKRFYYLVQQFRGLRGADVVAVASWNHEEKKNVPGSEMVERAMGRIQSPPDFVLAFQSPRSALADCFAGRLPRNSVVLGVLAHDLQVNLPGGVVEHGSNASAMYSSFPNSVVEPFSIESENEIEGLKARLLQKSARAGWKAMIVYACGDGQSFAEEFLTEMQAALPDISLVGGVCTAGYVSRARFTREQLARMTVRQLRRLNGSLGGAAMNFVEKREIVDHIFDISEGARELAHVEDSVFGVALGGDVPIRSAVSRGVTSLAHGGVPQPSSPYVVHASSLTRPSEDLNPIHAIHFLQNVEESRAYSAAELMDGKFHAADFIGIRRPGRDGFELHMLHHFCRRSKTYLIMTDGTPEQEESLEGAEVDLFVLDGESCLRDMEATASKLKEQTAGEEVLGAVMFSCGGRGPGRGQLVREEMADASRFAGSFPDVPCLGFYAGGEIGPLALAGKQNVFQTGRACLQGFTAVFALFIVPAAGPQRYHLDDCEENVNAFFVEKRPFAMQT